MITAPIVNLNYKPAYAYLTDKEVPVAYQTLAVQLLISAPGDIPTDDLATIDRTIRQWNFNVGQIVGVTVLPVSWTEHAAAEFGDRPQAILNHQIVEVADVAVALFRDRLGTPTGEAESGTAEEIQLLAEAGKPVGILVDTSPRPPLSGPQLDERKRLNEYLAKVRETALTFNYSGPADLASRLENFLSRATAQFQQRVQDSKTETGATPDPSEGVWPRAEMRETVDTDSKGRVKTKQHWSLVLHNMSNGPASKVDFSFPDLSEDAFFKVFRDNGPLGTIPPGGEARLPLALSMGSPRAVDCLVTWTDSSGTERETRATVRT